MEDDEGSVRDLLIAALKKQAEGKDYLRMSKAVRPCFEAPDYPDNSELYNLGMEYSLQSFWKRRSEKRLEEYEKKLVAKARAAAAKAQAQSAAAKKLKKAD